MNRSSDVLDVQALLRGDHAAFEQLVRQESPRLFQLLLRMLRDEEEAKNILQETFLQAYKRLHTFRGEAKVTTWLYAIGINLARASLRQSRRYDTLGEADIERLQPAFEGGMYAMQYEPWTPLDRLERTERAALVRGAVDALPPDYRLVVMLRDFDGLSTADTAHLLEISEGAVRVRLHRARQALRALLDQRLA